MPGGAKTSKLPNSQRDAKELRRLLELISSPAAKNQQYTAWKHAATRKIPTTRDTRDTGQHGLDPGLDSVQRQSAEVFELERFSLKYKDVRQFSNHQHQKYFMEICMSLIKNRLCSQEWLTTASDENILRVLMCLRILLRDATYQNIFCSLQGTKSLAEYFQKVTEEYLYSSERDGLYCVDILKEMTNIFQKLSASEDRCEWLVQCGAHLPLARLLTVPDVIVLHCSLYTLIRLAECLDARLQMRDLNVVDILLRIIQEYDTISKKLAANLLRLLSSDPKTREQVKLQDGVPILLSQLHSDNVSLLWHVVWCLVLLCEDAECRDDIRQMGGIPLILSLLHDRKFVSERTDVSHHPIASAGANRTPAFVQEDEEFFEHQYSLKKVCCTALAELVLNDANGQQIIQANGLYSLGLLVLPQNTSSEKDKKRATKLQQNAFRALRFLFSMERNRRLFKQLFPPELFEIFIDVGHYNRELSAYKPLADKMNSLPKAVINEIAENIRNTNQNKNPNYYIGDYAVFELLGTGAFGSVYKVRKRTGRQSFMALKEVNLQNTVFGKNDKEKATSVGEITNELRIMREEMRHPNIVRYYKTFEINNKLYILMDLIEGAHLGEHFISLKEKNDRFQESRVWNILIQLILALRYLHKEKCIVHRDLTPSNIMLGEQDKVTITDFGLAKQKRSDSSQMTSVVGTILYSCPEVVQNQAYGEKADIWAMGCILYQMCMLEPPFNSNNMLTLVKKIVAAEYKPVSEDYYSSRLIQTIKSCLCVSSDDRPDIVELSSQLSDILLRHMDVLRISQTALEKKLDKERRRTQKHYIEANQNMQNYHRLFLASQDGYDKLTNLSGSGGAEGLKETAVARQTSQEHGQDGRVGSSVALSLSSVRMMDISDEDSNPSSSSESRESSAGSMRSHFKPSLPPTANPAHHRIRPPSLVPQCQQSLELDIPNAAAKMSRDSGISSGDPSPNTTDLSSPHCVYSSLNGCSTQRQVFMHSVSAIEGPTSLPFLPRLDKRSRSTALLAISPSRLREINDPIQQMLHQVHKLVFITQLPPTLSPNPDRRMIEQFKRALFSPGSNPVNLKSELRKLMQGSRDIIDLNFGHPEYWKRSSQGSDLDSPLHLDKSVTPIYDPDYKDVGITYEYLQTILENLLEESGYYTGCVTTPNR